MVHLLWICTTKLGHSVVTEVSEIFRQAWAYPGMFWSSSDAVILLALAICANLEMRVVNETDDVSKGSRTVAT